MIVTDNKTVVTTNSGHNDASPTKNRREPVKSGMSKSMHDGVEVWCDCCSCEAEPYWVEAMQEKTE